MPTGVALPDPSSRGSLNLRTLALLRDRPRHLTYAKLAQLMSNASCRPVTVHWIHSYQSNRLENPDVDRIQALYEILTDKCLNVD